MLQEEAESDGNEPYISDLRKIHEAGTHLLAIISDILDLSLIEAGKMELCFETFDVREFVQKVATMVEPFVEKGENTFEVICAGDLGTMCGDAGKVRQSLVSLLDNASKFTRNGTVQLIANRDQVDDGDWLSISVSDTGIGMTREQVRSLFKDFTQVDGSATRKHGGTGLGLALSRRLCQMMGGDISIQSEPDKGSTFTMRLPADGTAISRSA
jgi:signal transduction histidine kinase